ncbi:DNA-binding transcriptional repressor RpiR [Enterococcus faecalis]|uniref:DNA-binding transcriptional repressor RpiR n=1 Tax=Enterococcus faecalis TaxID=1351 RepID=A0AAX2KXW2_ENTFL|nr:DNA-binding transcriptional repressor RpiR [Enterococcus faecalis]
MRVGIQAKAVLDPHYQAQVASLLTDRDLVIIFSLSGKTKDTYDSLKMQKIMEQKLAITNYIIHR